jgi:recombination protein RecT
MTQMTTQASSAITTLRDALTRMGGEFKVALPDHITPERFQRVTMTAIQRNPDLIVADRKTLFEACMMAAQDGLLPDGREAALVIFNTKRGDGWVKAVQYMPMVAGIRKKVYQSGEIKGLVARIAYQNDQFDVRYGDSERIDHTPNLFDRGEMIAAYAVATYRDGSKEFEVMTIDDIEKVRKISRSAGKGPWADWYEEMAKKTVIRRLSKNLPLSPELNDFMRRDDSFYDLNSSTTPARRIKSVQPQTIEARLDRFAGADDDDSGPAVPTSPEPETEETPSPLTSSESAPPEAQPSQPSQAEGGADAPNEVPVKIADAVARGRAARASGHKREVPKGYHYKSRQDEADAFLAGWDEENEVIRAYESGTV